MGRKLGSWLLVLVVGWFLRFGWNSVTAEPEAQAAQEEAALVLEDDEWVAEEIGTGSARMARGWLDDPRHGTFEADPAQMRELIDAFHAAGAASVWIVGIESLGENQLADSIAAELPAAGSARDAIFAAEAAFSGGEGTPDMGQRYLTVSLGD